MSGRFHCDACSKRQTTSWRSVNNAASQVHREVWFTLGKQEIPARPNSVDVRVGDKLKVVQFHPVIRNNSTPSPKKINFGWHQLGVLWIRKRPYHRKKYENRVSEQAAGVSRGVLWVRITSSIILSLSVKAT